MQLASWAVAAAWVWRAATALRNLPLVPDLCSPASTSALPPAAEDGAPVITVIVPACNEEAAIGQTLRSLTAQKGIALTVIAVDDRSTDATGRIMDEVAASTAARGRVRVVHVRELPPGWLGKTHAMALAAREAATPWLLFTDADVTFGEEALRRALGYCESKGADHMVLFPTLDLRGPGEKAVIAMFQTLSLWGSRPWKIPDPRARRDYLGVGAFNLVRQVVYSAVGGFEALRLEVLEDLRFGFTVKRCGFRQAVAFGRGLVRIRWAEGVGGIVRNLTKNIFGLFRFNPLLLLAACGSLGVLCLLPFGAPLLVGAPGLVPMAAMLAAITVIGGYYRRYTGIPTWLSLLFPLGALLLIWTLLRSMIVTLANGGVEWRGTRYPLRELRRSARSWF